LAKGERIRLKDLANIEITSLRPLRARVVGGELPQKKIQWVSDAAKFGCDVAVLSDLLKENGDFNENSMKIVHGYCESNCFALQEGEIIQFERFGFCRLDRKERDNLFVILGC